MNYPELVVNVPGARLSLFYNLIRTLLAFEDIDRITRRGCADFIEVGRPAREYLNHTNNNACKNFSF
jgi:hypothetical protein